MRKFLGLTAVLFLFSIAMIAQEEKKEIKKRVQMTSEQMATLQSKKMALALDLDKNQQKELKALLKKQGDLRLEKRKSFQAAKGNKERPSTEDRYKLMNDRLDQQIAHKTAMKNILSEAQFEKWSKMTKGKERRIREMAQKRRQGRSYQHAGKTRERTSKQRMRK